MKALGITLIILSVVIAILLILNIFLRIILQKTAPPLLKGFIRTHDYMNEDNIIDINKSHIYAITQKDEYTLIEFDNKNEPAKVKERLEELI